MGLFGAGLNFGIGANSTPVVNQYTTAGSFSWAKCPGATAVGIVVIGGGGGGGDSTNSCTTGCGNYCYPGGGAGGGGGISACVYQATQVATCAAINVGGGGSRNPIVGGDGGCSTFVGGVTVCASGGRGGEGSYTANSNSTNGGAGGFGTTRCGAAGGAGFAVQNGDNGGIDDNTTKGGGGGGGARYKSTVPTCIYYTSQGSASAAKNTNLNWACFNIGDYGAGGMGGNASMNNQRSVTGTNGSVGYVYVIQYF